jgi:hypothetical protein
LLYRYIDVVLKHLRAMWTKSKHPRYKQAYGIICLIDADDMRFVHFLKTEEKIFQMFPKTRFLCKNCGLCGLRLNLWVAKGRQKGYGWNSCVIIIWQGPDCSCQGWRFRTNGNQTKLNNRNFSKHVFWSCSRTIRRRILSN